MRSQGWVLIQQDSCPCKKRKSHQGQRPREGPARRQPSASQGARPHQNLTWPTLCSQASSLQNREDINFYNELNYISLRACGVPRQALRWSPTAPGGDQPCPTHRTLGVLMCAHSSLSSGMSPKGPLLCHFKPHPSRTAQLKLHSSPPSPRSPKPSWLLLLCPHWNQSELRGAVHHPPLRASGCASGDK